MKDYLNSQMDYLIGEHIHKKRDRLIMRMYYLDGCSYDEIAECEEVNLSARWVAYLISKYTAKIAKYL